MSAGYDPVELRRRIAVCLSAAEIQRFGADLDVAVAADRGAETAARELVREAEKRGELARLVEKLRVERPLVEWPEPTSEITPPPPSKPAVQFIPASVAPPPMPPPLEPIASEVAAPADAAPSSTNGGAARKLPDLPAWPGTVAIAPAPQRGIDPKIFIAVSALTVAAAIIAYVAGRASTSGTAAPVASTSASPARRPAGPATEAADAMARGIAHVARACEVAPGAANEVFRRAYERCGPAPAPPRPSSPPVDATLDLPPLDEDPGRELAQPRIPKTPDPSAPTNGCVASCDATHRGCRARCGPEPTQSTQYGEYQQCLGHCLSVASKCRLGCP